MTEGTPSNLTGLRSLSSTRYFLDARGAFAWEAKPGVRISGLPHLRMLGFSGDSLRLPDGSLLLVAKSILGTGPGRLSCVAIRSEDGGFTWRFASVVAAASEVPYAVEGPSEASLALLANGTLLAVMRVEGQSGHYAPYISKLSDDGGRTWRALRSLRGGGSGGVPGAGCVRPRLLALEIGGARSLVLTGGRPNPLSRDQLLWLNPKGDAEEWEAYSLSYWHNRLLDNASHPQRYKQWAFPPAATNASRAFPREDTSYNSLVRTGDASGFVLYGCGPRAFAMRFEVVEEAGLVEVVDP